MIAAATASDAAAAYFHDLAHAFIDAGERTEKPEPSWTTPNRAHLAVNDHVIMGNWQGGI